MSRRCSYGFLIATLVCLGCVSEAMLPKAHPDAMTIQTQRAIHKSPSSVVVAVPRAHTTPAMYLPQITSEDYTQALRQSIEHSGLFAKAKKDGQATFELHAFVNQVDQPMLGSSMTVSMEVTYILARMQPKQVIWQKVVASTYTTPFLMSLDGGRRALLATEGAARMNIEQAIQEISQLRLE